MYKRQLTRLVGRANAILDISLRKYAWQFGTSDFAEVVARVQTEAPPVLPEAITRPSLFLLGDGEATELRRQTEELTADMQRRGVDVTIRRFSHCLLYTSDAADERSSVDLGGRRIITKINTNKIDDRTHNNKTSTPSRH